MDTFSVFLVLGMAAGVLWVVYYQSRFVRLLKGLHEELRKLFSHDFQKMPENMRASSIRQRLFLLTGRLWRNS